jgi:hypothetical protein
MDFKDLTMQFQQEGQQYKFQGITTGSPEIISSHHMEKLLKKGLSRIIAQLHSIHVVETPFVHPISAGSHSWIACRRRAQHPSVFMSRFDKWVIKWVETRTGIASK